MIREWLTKMSPGYYTSKTPEGRGFTHGFTLRKMGQNERREGLNRVNAWDMLKMRPSGGCTCVLLGMRPKQLFPEGAGSDHSETRQFGCIVIVDVVKVWMVGKVGGFPNGRRRAFGKCPTVALKDNFVK